MRLVCGIVPTDNHYDRYKPAGEGWSYRCCQCGKVRPGDEMAADLDGPAFVAYYCPACADVLLASS